MQSSTCRLEAEGAYFSEKDMRERQPGLYHHFIGQVRAGFPCLHCFPNNWERQPGLYHFIGRVCPG